MMATSRGGDPLGWMTSGIGAHCLRAVGSQWRDHFRQEMTYTQSHLLLVIGPAVHAARHHQSDC